MTAEAQRIAIGTLMGYTNIRRCTCTGEWLMGTNPAGHHVAHIKDWLSDLNAMHEAEKVLLLDPFETAANDTTETAMVLAERVLAYQTRLFELQPGLPSSICHFTAAQRAEAFLRTIGKFVD